MDGIEQEMSELIVRPASTGWASSVVKFPGGPSYCVQDAAADAINLVSGAATAAKNLASAAIERIERTETALRNAEIDVAELTAAVADARNEIEQAQTQLAARESELAAAEQRASLAERRASDAERRASHAEAAVERIVDAIRTQFPAKSWVAAAEKVSAAA